MTCCGFDEGARELITTSDAVCKLLRLPIPLYLQKIVFYIKFNYFLVDERMAFYF